MGKNSKEWQHKYYLTHKPQISAKAKRWRDKNPEKRRMLGREWRRKHPDVGKVYTLRNMYGISPRDYKQMVIDQEGVCYLCHQLPGKKGLCVDHDHDTGAVRGLLCERCNTGLGVYEALIKVAGEDNIKQYQRRGARWTALSD